MRGDFANLPPGTPHAWTMKSDGAQFALFSMNHRVGAAFIAMGDTARRTADSRGVPHDIPAGRLARAAAAGDFQLVAAAAPAASAVRVTNKQLPLTPGAYVLADGGGERFGGNTFLARNANTTGNSCSSSPRVVLAAGSARISTPVTSRTSTGSTARRSGGRTARPCLCRTGDYFQAPPRNLHGFRLNQQYNRFAAFLTPGIFENFFVMMGSRGRGGDGRGGAPQAGRGEADGRAVARSPAAPPTCSDRCR